MELLNARQDAALRPSLRATQSTLYCVVDAASGCIRFSSPSVREALRYAEPLEGRLFAEFFAVSDTAVVLVNEALTRARDDGSAPTLSGADERSQSAPPHEASKPVGVEAVMMRGDGTDVVFSWSIFLGLDGFLHVFGTDLTSRDTIFRLATARFSTIQDVLVAHVQAALLLLGADAAYALDIERLESVTVSASTVSTRVHRAITDEADSLHLASTGLQSQLRSGSVYSVNAGTPCGAFPNEDLQQSQALIEHIPSADQCHRCCPTLHGVHVASHYIAPIRHNGICMGALCIVYLADSKECPSARMSAPRSAGGVYDSGTLGDMTRLATSAGVHLAFLSADADRLRRRLEIDKFFDMSASIICVADLDGNVLRVNVAMCTALSFTETELLSSSLQSLAHPDDRAAVCSQLQQAVQHRLSAVRFCSRFQTSDRESRMIDWEISFQHQSNFCVGTGRDVTEDLRREEELQRSKQVAVEATKSKVGGTALISLSRC